MRQRERARQIEFGFASWGGKRRGAGRKPKGERALVSHAPRAELAERFPVHVTLKLVTGCRACERRRRSPFCAALSVWLASACGSSTTRCKRTTSTYWSNRRMRALSRAA